MFEVLYLLFCILFFVGLVYGVYVVWQEIKDTPNPTIPPVERNSWGRASPSTWVSDESVWGERYPEIQIKEKFLQDLADEYLPLFDGMPPVKVLLVRTQGESQSVKFGDKPHNRAAAFGGGGYVYIKENYFRGAELDSLVSTIKHEMTHNWTQWKGIWELDHHGPRFQAKLAEVLG